MSEITTVFVSATTRDLGTCRQAVRDVLLGLGVHPVVQDDFSPDYRAIVEILRKKISECDAVICQIGRAHV